MTCAVRPVKTRISLSLRHHYRDLRKPKVLISANGTKSTSFHTYVWNEMDYVPMASEAALVFVLYT